MERSDSFGHWLRRRRKACDLTQQELANQAGCTVAMIRRIEADERRPSRELAARLATVLDVAPGEQSTFLRAARAQCRVDKLELAIAPLTPAPARAFAARSHNLPAPPNALIGRERETVALCALLRRAHTRLVTLTGSGGTGKTRLALQVATKLIEHYADGVWFVDLAPLSHSDLVLPTVARALGLRDSGKEHTQEHLVAYLSGKQVLLVLDNFEHVLAAAPQLAALLAALAGLRLLVTSRAPLQVRAEQEYPVLPLALPDNTLPACVEQVGQYDAVRLFIERARAARPDFALTEANLQAVAAICTRLDGLPLAIELAAARLRLFAPMTLLARLDDCLALLTHGVRDLPARQQSLRSTIDWSYHLLGDDERLLFLRLGVFAGGWTLPAAEAVAGDTLIAANRVPDLIESLIEMSIVRGLPAATGEMRFTMLATLREYALARLTERGEVEMLRRRHATYFLMLAEQAEPGLSRPLAGRWLDQLEADYSNLRMALQWSQRSGESELGLRVATALSGFWHVRGRQHDGYTRLTELLTLANGGVQEQVWGRALVVVASLAAFFGEGTRVDELGTAGLAIAERLDDQRLRARALLQLGANAGNAGKLTRGLALLEESLQLFTTIGDQRGMADALTAVAHAYVDRPQALQYYSERLALARACGYDEVSSFAITKLGEAAAERGEFERAEAYIREGISLARNLRHLYMLAGAQYSLAKLALAQGKLDEAAALMRECCELARKQNDLALIVLTLGSLGRIAFWQGDLELAWERFHECLALLGDSFPTDKPRLMATLGKLVEAAGDPVQAASYYAESLELYRAVEDHIGIAWAQRNLGYLRFMQGDPARCARRLYASIEGLQSREGGNDARNSAVVVSCLSAAAELIEQQGKAKAAARLWGAAPYPAVAAGSPTPHLPASAAKRTTKKCLRRVHRDA